MSNQNPPQDPETTANLVPPVEVYLEGLSQVDADTFDDETLASSAMPSRRTVRLAALFPTNKDRFGKMKANILIFLQETLGLDVTFISRMEQCGFITMSIIINRFGIDIRSIAKAFAMMGPSHILDHQMHEQTMNLVMFARSQILKGNFMKPSDAEKSWQELKKSSKFNGAFDNWRPSKVEDVLEFLTDPNHITVAQREMHQIRAKIRSWINNESISISSNSTKTPKGKSPMPISSSLQDSFKSTESPMASLMVTVRKMEAKMDTEFGDIRTTIGPQLEDVKSAIKAVKSSVRKEVDLEVERKLSATINNRTKDAIKKHLGHLFKDSEMPKTVTYEEQQAGTKSEASSSDENTDSEEDKNPPFEIPIALPRTHVKSNRSRRSSFYRSGNRKAHFEVPKSPLDVDFYVGCNDDLISSHANPSETSLTSDQKEQGRQTRDWMRKAAQDAKSKMAVLCTSTTQLKRSPLPITVQWNGKGGFDFEKYIDKVTGHIAQQPHMGYLLLDSIALLWLKHGEATIVLKTGIQRGLHPSLHHVSASQFITDIVWLFGAMQQLITLRGRNIVREHESHQDGILAWKRFVDTHRYDGDVDVHLSQQQQVVTQRFHSTYPGGMISFLEDYETAFMNIEYVMRRKPITGSHESRSLYTDDGKRRLFIQNFTVPDLTAELIESVENNTETWDAMVDQLRRRLARRTIHSNDVARRKAHYALGQNQLNDLDLSTPASIMATMNSPAFINALSLDWKVGYQLWKNLTDELKKKVQDIRDQHLPLPPNSGGDSYQNRNRMANQKPTGGPQYGNKDIIKAPDPSTQKDSPKIPMQYSSNQTQVTGNEEHISMEDEEVQTFLSLIKNASSSIPSKAHTKYLAMLVNYTQDDLCIPDGGADSHVGGRTWLPLTPLSGPNVKFANVTGFDEESARKFNLPIVAAVLKTVNEEGKEIFLRAKHLIFNATSAHTLLSTYQMRERGIIVDDVSRRHLKDETTNGTHTITFPSEGHVINLTTRGALSTFSVSKPTLSEYLNASESTIVDISIENWNPQEHHEALLQNIPSIEIPVMAHQTISHDMTGSVTSEEINFITQFDEDFEDPFSAFFTCQEDEFFDTHNEDDPMFHDASSDWTKGGRSTLGPGGSVQNLP
jgi:hypothetical protein